MAEPLVIAPVPCLGRGQFTAVRGPGASPEPGGSAWRVGLRRRQPRGVDQHPRLRRRHRRRPGSYVRRPGRPPPPSATTWRDVSARRARPRLRRDRRGPAGRHPARLPLRHQRRRHGLGRQRPARGAALRHHREPAAADDHHLGATPAPGHRSPIVRFAFTANESSTFARAVSTNGTWAVREPVADHDGGRRTGSRCTPSTSRAAADATPAAHDFMRATHHHLPLPPASGQSLPPPTTTPAPPAPITLRLKAVKTEVEAADRRRS